MRFDWQSYEDGEMSAEARREAEDALRTDPHARRELEGLRSFRKSVREAGLREPVPVRRLEKGLASVVGPRQGAWRIRLGVVAAGIAAVALGYLFFGDRDPHAEQRRTFSSMAAASQWASDLSALDVPPIRLGNGGRLDSVHGAEGWACFDYVSTDGTIHVLVTKGRASKSGCQSVATKDGTVFVHSASAAARFEHGGLLYVVSGLGEDRTLPVAQSLLVSLSRGG